MSTAAFCDGKAGGYYGLPKECNPYRKGWARLGLGDQLTSAEQWDAGYQVGWITARAEQDLLVKALDNLGRMAGGTGYVEI